MFKILIFKTNLSTELLTDFLAASFTVVVGVRAQVKSSISNDDFSRQTLVKRYQ